MAFIDLLAQAFPVVAIAYFSVEFVRFVSREVSNGSQVVSAQFADDSADLDVVISEVVINDDSDLSANVSVSSDDNDGVSEVQPLDLDALKAIAKAAKVKGYNLYKSAEKLNARLVELSLI